MSYDKYDEHIDYLDASIMEIEYFQEQYSFEKNSELKDVKMMLERCIKFFKKEKGNTQFEKIF